MSVAEITGLPSSPCRFETEPLWRLALEAAPTKATVLMTGETGTGKDVLARAIHGASRRRLKPFVAMNCAVLERELLASDLFGHERGAFTGATDQRMGRIERADGGTLFLDEIGELHLDLQAKLLHVLQDGSYERVGGAETRTADLRILAATNRDLLQEVQRGAFRADLYYRLNVVPLHIPPLRQRPQELLALAHQFLEEFNSLMGRRVRLCVDAVEVLLGYSWPGNIRELRNTMERVVTLVGKEEELSATAMRQFLSSRHDSLLESEIDLRQGIRDLRRRELGAGLVAAKGNIAKAARTAGMSRTTYRRQLSQLGLLSTSQRFGGSLTLA